MPALYGGCVAQLNPDEKRKTMRKAELVNILRGENMSQYGITECPNCNALTSNVIQCAGTIQFCTCRICNSIFRAEVNSAGHFTGKNVRMISPVNCAPTDPSMTPKIN